MDDMKILVTGDRNWNDYLTMETVLLHIYQNIDDDTIYLVHGDCRGADRMARNILLDISIKYPKIKFIEYKVPADWDSYGKSAGCIRNSKMLELHPDISLCMAFHNNISSSKGTKDMINKIIKSDKPCWLIHNKTINKIINIIY